MRKPNPAVAEMIAHAEANKREAIGLLDIVPAYRDVPLNAKQAIRITALSTRDLITIVSRFPALQGLMVGQGLGPATVASIAPEAIAAIIAAAVGHLGEPQYEERAAALPPDFQLDALGAVFETTFTNGFGPFVQKLVTAFNAVASEVGKAPATESPKQPLHSATQKTKTS